MRCFGCNQEGHSVRNCPDKVQKEAEFVQVNENAGEGTSDVAEASAVNEGEGCSAGSERKRVSTVNAGEQRELRNQESIVVASNSAEVCEELSQTSTQGVQQGMDVDE
ncbi:hypothetical protein XENOCAPTIV_017583 [Xenoophorus captivus]|uniref:CCHC-type domain-containing protein n=1 Tax=Xenoophorus captivus TaxID=1517983 RepID=A0ABV0S142_9TELE